MVPWAFRAPTNTSPLSPFLTAIHSSIIINIQNTHYTKNTHFIFSLQLSSPSVDAVVCLNFKRKDIILRGLLVSMMKVMNFEEESAVTATAPMKQGIVAILGSDNRENHTYKSSIRRTLSADMSSKKWLEQNGFINPMKKINSSEVFVRRDRIPPDSSSVSSSSSSDCERNDKNGENPCQDDVWKSIQAGNERNRAKKMDSWGALLTQKSEGSISLLPPAPPYVPPAAKKAATCLSEKSLEICTESLGSETGSDCFSAAAAAAEVSDSDNEECRLKEVSSFSDLQIVKYREAPARPFPPPLPSIAGGGRGVSLHMQSRRENGRLVLEAVSVPAKNYFQADRRDGRLVLTLIRMETAEEAAEEEEEGEVEECDGEVFGDMEEVGGDVATEDGGCEEEVAEEVGAEKELRSVPMGVPKAGLVMKFVAVGNKNPVTWTNKFNESVAAAATVEKEEFVVPQSLPPPPRVARLIPSPAPPLAAASFNSYEYFWRKNSAACGGGGFANPVITAVQQPTNAKHAYNTTAVHGGAKAAYENQEFIPYLRGCKEPRRSLFWEPYCIATS